MENKILTFDDCIKIADANGGKKHLLLGNGFSVAIFPKIFNYKILADKITSEKIKNLFKELGTNDFEYVYDLLLYWVYMHFLDNKEMRLKSDDGFRHPEHDESIVTWEIGQEREQNLYYLHGVLHIFSDDSEIEKYTWINTGSTLTQQIKDSLKNEMYPVFITEGSRRQKQNRINNNAYL